MNYIWTGLELLFPQISASQIARITGLSHCASLNTLYVISFNSYNNLTISLTYLEMGKLRPTEV
jgi:hypothetical protein